MLLRQLFDSVQFYSFLELNVLFLGGVAPWENLAKELFTQNPSVLRYLYSGSRTGE